MITTDIKGIVGKSIPNQTIATVSVILRGLRNAGKISKAQYKATVRHSKPSEYVKNQLYYAFKQLQTSNSKGTYRKRNGLKTLLTIDNNTISLITNNSHLFKLIDNTHINSDDLKVLRNLISQDIERNIK